MAKLIATTPLAGRLPVTLGTVTITETVVQTAWLVAPFAGKQAAVSKVLKQAVGAAWPKPCRMTRGDADILWIAGGQALVIGADVPDLSGLAAVTDQADGLAVARVTGQQAEAVLARLVPVDLRLASFPKCQTARTMIGHMTGSVTRVAPDAFDVMVMRSMAGTLVHDLERAATGVAGR